MTSADQILNELQQLLTYFIPEGILALTLVLVTVISFRKKVWWMIPHITGIIGLATSIIFLLIDSAQVTTTWFIISGESVMWRILLDGILAVIFLFRTNRHLQSKSPEFVIISLMILLGAHFLVMANHLFLAYLSIEIMSLSAYMLVALPLYKKQISAAFKYLVFGAISSGIMLYGISLLYGMTGTLTLMDLNSDMIIWSQPLSWLVYLLILSGILFKVGAVPFHVWLPDVYKSAPIPVLTVLSAVPKISAMIFLIRWYDHLPESVFVISLLAIVTIAAGNFGALRQNHIRKLLGFSAIAQTGFMLSGILLSGYNLAFLEFYIVLYGLMTVGIFHSLNYFELTYGTENIDDLAGASKASPVRTIRIVIWMIALTGLPPTAGFTAKLFLFSGLTGIWSDTASSIVLVVLIFGVLNAVVSLAYYLKIPYQMIFRQSLAMLWKEEKIFSKENFLGTILVLAVLILFFKPEWLMGWINNVSFVP